MINGDIFIVDDNANNLHLLEKILRENNYKVRMATNGKRALSAINNALPELIILDVNMPDLDGYQVCGQLKASPKTSTIPIIFLSALDDVLDKVKAFKVGGVDYITKPFQTEEVIARIENQLTISRLRKELEKRNEQLAKEKEALLLAQKRTDMVFSALTEVLPGTILDGKYRLDEKIGSGGFGAVYKATQLNLNRLIAIKVFHPSKTNSSVEALERFRLEGISASKINHPNSLSIIDFGISSTNIAYLAMELLEGCTLRKEITKNASLAVLRSLEILLPVCSVLATAHRLGIIHRDIKPDNIFLHKGKEGEVVKVLDFGVAKIFGDETNTELQNLTVGNLVLGTPNYLAPERIQNKNYDGRADIYSLGVVFYKMLTGVSPFASSSVLETISLQLEKQPQNPREINPKIPIEVEKLVLRMLEKNPDLRFTSEELLEKIEELLNSEMIKLGVTDRITSEISTNQEDFDTSENSLERDTLKFSKTNTTSNSQD
ncbi:MAG: protein kinase [Blastocatellia bacterium]|nr:protein kinase [Blastocatellia bacterium]MBN8723696.1 protein kinase [Acidobacteriota bacterium]